MEKDVVMKSLLEMNDVFSDIVNVNIFHGKPVLKADMLRAMPTEGHYTDLKWKDLQGAKEQKEDGIQKKHHSLFRDVLKEVDDLDGCCFAVIGQESQTGISNTMPVRVMGYNYVEYKRQIQKLMAENRGNNHSAYTKEIHDNQKLCPVITIVLYFGLEEWTKPLTLLDMLRLPDDNQTIWKELIGDYSIRLIPMRNQPEEIRNLYQSDYRLIAEYLACCNDKKELDKAIQKYGRNLLHMEEVLDMLEVFSGDRHYEKLKEICYEQAKKTGEKVQDMCLLLDMYWNDGVEHGIKQGMECGMERGMERGIEVFIQTFQELKRTMEDTRQLIIEKFSLSPEQADEYMKKYW